MKSPSLRASFGFALQGLFSVIRKERNMKIHLLALVAVTLAGLYFRLSYSEWLSLIVVMGMVLTTETINTAVERVVDMISPDLHPAAAQAKNIAAAAVLISVITAVTVGILIFGTRIW